MDRAGPRSKPNKSRSRRSKPSKPKPRRPRNRKPNLTPSPPTKAAIRWLPHNLTKEAIEDALSPHLEKINYLDFQQGKQSQRKYRPSVCFVNFNTHNELLQFAVAFSGHAFVDQTGREYNCIVEYAANQNVPGVEHSSSTDPLQGTIETDSEYLAFCESLKEIDFVKPLPSAEVQLDKRLIEQEMARIENNGETPPIMSPLMASIIKKKANTTKKRAANKKANRAERRRRQRERDKLLQQEGKQLTGDHSRAPAKKSSRGSSNKGGKGARRGGRGGTNRSRGGGRGRGTSRGGQHSSSRGKKGGSSYTSSQHHQQRRGGRPSV